MQSANTLPFGERGPAASPSSRPPSSRVLGRYRLLERLGAGGFGVVWRAQDERLDRQVAVKRIVLGPGAVPERVTREALASARLAHPAIVALYEAASDDGAFYLVSELVRGPTLAELIRADELTDDAVLAIGLSLCDALGHAHERGVIHRDVKPHNVLVPASGADHPAAAKLADFGGAWITGEDPLTRTGDVMGTLAYMSPEQAEGAEVGTESDLYSCALVCFEALSGVNPVRGTTPASTARNIGTDLPSLHEYRPDLPGELVSAIDVALDPVAEYRGELRDLSTALAEAASVRPSRSGRSWARRRPRAEPPVTDVGDDPTGLTRRDRAAGWPAVDWEGADPAPLGDAATRPHRSPRAYASVPPGPRAHRHPAERFVEPLAPEAPGVGPPVRGDEAPVRGDEAPVAPRGGRILGAPARLLDGLGAGALAAAALYGLGGASQQLALAGAALTAIAVALLPRLGWLAATTAVCAWLVAAQAAGGAVLVAAAALPVAVVLRRPGPAWPAAALAPLLGLAGLAGAFPAVAGQLGSWTRRAALGALGYWWLVLAELLTGRRLWLGAPPHAWPRAAWEGSVTAAAHHALLPLLTAGVLFGALLWAVGAAVLPWIVRGRSVAVDVVAATVWTAAMAAAAPLLDRGGLAPVTGTSPRGLVLGAVLAGLVAVVARGARGAPTAAPGRD